MKPNPPMTKRKFCSTCRHSKYVLANNIRKLLCKQRQAFGQNPFIDTACTDAEVCLDYAPENWHSNLTTRSGYSHMMKKCGIPLEEEEKGILSSETLA